MRETNDYTAGLHINGVLLLHYLESREDSVEHTTKCKKITNLIITYAGSVTEVDFLPSFICL